MLEGLLDKYRDELQGYYAEGRADGEARAILSVLRARGISVPEEICERIQSCRDLSLLDQWLERALKVNTADELFAAS